MPAQAAWFTVDSGSERTVYIGGLPHEDSRIDASGMPRSPPDFRRARLHARLRPV